MRIILLAVLAAFVTAHVSAAPLQAVIDAYLAQVNEMSGRALLPELAKHRELVKGTTKFSYRIDLAGHPNDIKAV